VKSIDGPGGGVFVAPSKAGAQMPPSFPLIQVHLCWRAFAGSLVRPLRVVERQEDMDS